MRISEIKALGREEIIQLAAEKIQARLDTFSPGNFDRIRVLAKDTSVRVSFGMRCRFVPKGKDEFDLSYGAEAVLSEGSVTVRAADNLFIPTDESRAASAFLADLELPDDATVTVYENDGYYEATVNRGIDGGAEGYKINKATGERKMIWHEHPDPSLHTSILGLSGDEFEEL